MVRGRVSDRRSLLRVIAVGIGASVAGCAEPGEEEEEDGEGGLGGEEEDE